IYFIRSVYLSFVRSYGAHRDLHSFPTRRSSDLGQPEHLGEAVHRVRGEHPGAGAAGGAGVLLDVGELGVGDRVVGAQRHRVDQVDPVLGDALDGLAGLGGAAGDEDDRDVQAHRGHEVAGGDLVAVGDAHQGVGGVGVDHVLDRVGDDVAARQGVEHAAVAHRDAVVHGDGVELLGDAAGL